MNVHCVIVTYNRINLLKECVASVTKQSYPIHKIIIIDNCSTDGTEDYLKTLTDAKFIIVRTDENIGGAGGFSLGIKRAVSERADWIWLMDDDTIPQANALERLVAATSLTDNVGFACSKVIWTDGTPHAMNALGVQTGPSFNRFSTEHVPAFPCKLASFVSVLINAFTVWKVGLPYKEFFIWGDDVEYTERISKLYNCFYVDNSIVVHKTATNYKPHPDIAPAETAWKFYYDARNRAFKMRKRNNKFIAFIKICNMYRVYIHRINKRKTGDRHLFKKQVYKGCIDALSFNPQIEYME